MMFDDVLIESAGKDKKKGGWMTAVISTVIHLSLIGAVIAAGYYVKKNPEVIEKPIAAFIVTSAPPPPPPPPPASSSGSTQPKTQTIETPKKHEFRQPTDIPRDVPQVSETPSTDTASEPGGVVGGVKGGQIGGVVGGVIGGTIGGTLGGTLGGQLGATGTGPVRVGGDVKAPTVIEPRADPKYTEIARKARISGIVIIEAIIDRDGNVTDAHVLKGLPMGLDDEALNAIRKWKFRPGTLNGQPVAVYYNLTVNFRLNQ
jgi:periplasmic protein TonB